MTLFASDLQYMCVSICPSFSIFSPFFLFHNPDPTQIHKQKWFSVFILILPCFFYGLTIKFLKKDLRLACQHLDANTQTSSEGRPDSNYSAFQSSDEENVTLNLPWAHLREEPPEAVFYFIRVPCCWKCSWPAKGHRVCWDHTHKGPGQSLYDWHVNQKLRLNGGIMYQQNEPVKVSANWTVALGTATIVTVYSW